MLYVNIPNDWDNLARFKDFFYKKRHFSFNNGICGDSDILHGDNQGFAILQGLFYLSKTNS